MSRHCVWGHGAGIKKQNVKLLLTAPWFKKIFSTEKNFNNETEKVVKYKIGDAKNQEFIEHIATVGWKFIY